eukprot:3850370-Pleurochrysis_carterae.AAC.1
MASEVDCREETERIRTCAKEKVTKTGARIRVQAKAEIREGNGSGQTAGKHSNKSRTEVQSEKSTYQMHK